MPEPLINLQNPALGAAELRAALQLAPHPEGGWYRETWRDVPAGANRRGAASAIIFLLAENEQSAWHRVDAAEIWLWHAGAPLELRIAAASAIRTVWLGPVFSPAEPAPPPDSDKPGLDNIGIQAVVPAFAWQAARSTGAWTLVSCIVAPAFSFAGFELAPAGVLPTDATVDK